MKTKTLFDHIKQITNVQNQLYWDNITDADKKTWSNYMVHRFLSMKAEWIEVVNTTILGIETKISLSILHQHTTKRKYIFKIH